MQPGVDVRALQPEICAPHQWPLRGYQKDAKAKILEHFRNGVRRVLLVQPTGSGKGTMSADIIGSTAAKGKRCLFLVNRKEIVRDQSRRLTKLGIDHGVIMSGDPRRKPLSLVHVASKDTIQNRVKPPANLVFIDECHFAVSDGWTKVLEAYNDSFVIGMTATPVRLDGKGLGQFFDVIVEGPSIAELQEMGFLVETRVFGAAEVDTSNIRKQAGDFNQTQLAETFDKATLVGDIVEHWLRLGENRPTVCFAVNKAHSEHIAGQFREAGVTAVAVDADTPDEERDTTWAKLRTGVVKVVCAVGIISYGWDEPIVSCAILARPTQSLALYLQQVGRVLRPYEGKEYAIILDHAGNTQRHGFVQDERKWTLDGFSKPSKDDDEKGPSVSTCKECFFIFASHLKDCPACGTERQATARELKVAAGQLVELKKSAVDPLEMHERFMSDPQVAPKYRPLVAIALQVKKRNWKPGALAVKFNQEMGAWPSKAWKEAANAAADRELSGGHQS